MVLESELRRYVGSVGVKILWSVTLAFIMLPLPSRGEFPPPKVEIVALKGKLPINERGKPQSDGKGEARRCLVLKVEDTTPAVREISIQARQRDPLAVFIPNQSAELELDRADTKTYPCPEDESDDPVKTVVGPIYVCSETDLKNQIEEMLIAGDMTFEVTTSDCQKEPQERKTFVRSLPVRAKRVRIAPSEEEPEGGAGFVLEFDDVFVVPPFQKSVDPASVIVEKTSPEVEEADAKKGDEVKNEDGNVMATAIEVSGKLKKGERSGHVVVTGDPPLEDFAVAVKIIDGAAIPAMGVWGAMAFTLLMLVGGYFLIRRWY